MPDSVVAIMPRHDRTPVGTHPLHEIRGRHGRRHGSRCPAIHTDGPTQPGRRTGTTNGKYAQGNERFDERRTKHVTTHAVRMKAQAKFQQRRSPIHP